MERMARIRAVHADEAVIEAEAGVILSDVHAADEGVGVELDIDMAEILWEEPNN